MNQEPEKTHRAHPLTAGAFADCYTFYLPQVKAFLSRAGCDAHSLDDLAQETFLRAWNARTRFPGNVQFQTWLLGIARNTARESWRKRTLNTESLAHELPNEPTREILIDAERTQAVRAAIDRLPPKQRLAIRLVYLNGITQTDAAVRVNCAQDAFRRRLFCGRAQLRKLLSGND